MWSDCRVVELQVSGLFLSQHVHLSITDREQPFSCKGGSLPASTPVNHRHGEALHGRQQGVRCHQLCNGKFQYGNIRMIEVKQLRVLELVLGGELSAVTQEY